MPSIHIFLLQPLEVVRLIAILSLACLKRYIYTLGRILRPLVLSRARALKPFNNHLALMSFFATSSQFSAVPLLLSALNPQHLGKSQVCHFVNGFLFFTVTATQLREFKKSKDCLFLLLAQNFYSVQGNSCCNLIPVLTIKFIILKCLYSDMYGEFGGGKWGREERREEPGEEKELFYF